MHSIEDVRGNRTSNVYNNNFLRVIDEASTGKRLIDLYRQFLSPIHSVVSRNIKDVISCFEYYRFMEIFRHQTSVKR